MAENKETLRAEECVAEVYRQLLEQQKTGSVPVRVIMTMDQYKSLQSWHKSLGAIQGTVPDYISENSLFGLEILIDSEDLLRVE